MKTTWLNKQNNNTCILFFNGWGMDENTVRHLISDGFDILEFNDFNPISEIERIDYEKIFVVAWSLGVFTASKVLTDSSLKIDKAIAINGTQKPIGDSFGIPTAIFANTLNTWNERNRDKFNMRILGGRSLYESFKHHLSNRKIENQQAELIYIQEMVLSEPATDFQFDTAVISQQDLIFSPENQRNYWKGKSKIVEINAPHFPFEKFKTWEEIIEI